MRGGVEANRAVVRRHGIEVPCSNQSFVQVSVKELGPRFLCAILIWHHQGQSPYNANITGKETVEHHVPGCHSFDTVRM